MQPPPCGGRLVYGEYANAVILAQKKAIEGQPRLAVLVGARIQVLACFDPQWPSLIFAVA